MTVAKVAWRIELAAAANRDVVDILRWTTQAFGSRQAASYEATLTRALENLQAGPTAAGAKRRPELGLDIYLLHVAKKRRRGRHFLVFRPLSDRPTPTIQVLRILHDAMDLARHLPDTSNEA